MVLSTGDMLAIIVGLIAFAVGVAAFFRQHPDASPAAVDAEVASRLDLMQHDREAMDRLERAYQSSDAAHRNALDAAVSVLKQVAPLTPLKSDDAALKLLLDAQKLGAPEDTTG